MRKLYVLLMVVFLFIPVPNLAVAFEAPGNPSGFVNDYAGLFSIDQRGFLEDKLTLYEQASSNEIAIITVENLQGEPIEDVAVQLFKDWGIGKEAEDNGVLLLIARDDREMRIEVGYGLEGSLTDIYASRIIRETLTPAFQAGDFYGGVDRALDQMMSIISGGTLEEAGAAPIEQFEGLGGLAWFVIVFFIWMMSILARSKSWWGGGIVGGVFSGGLWLFTSSILYGLLSAIVLVPLGLLFDYYISRAYADSKSGGKTPPWWAGGGRGGWGGGSSGFGGFGGGSSGGGGASGRW